MEPTKFGKRVVLVEADYNDFDELVNKYFETHHGFKPYEEDKQTYEFAPIEECGNDSEHRFNGIDGEIDTYYQAKIDKAIEIKDFYKAGVNNRAMLNYLCSKGCIEPADYLISVSW